MSWYELLALLALTGYAIVRQTRRSEVIGNTRFKLAIIYGIVGLAIGGMHLPRGGWEIAFLAISLALSIGIGMIRGHYTRVWRADGVVYSQGTAFTVSLFVLLIVGKFALGTAAYFLHVTESGGFGEILLMIALMVAFQAEIIWRRAEPLGARRTAKDQVTAVVAAPDSIQR